MRPTTTCPTAGVYPPDSGSVSTSWLTRRTMPQRLATSAPSRSRVPCPRSTESPDCSSITSPTATHAHMPEVEGCSDSPRRRQRRSWQRRGSGGGGACRSGPVQSSAAAAELSFSLSRLHGLWTRLRCWEHAAPTVRSPFQTSEHTQLTYKAPQKWGVKGVCAQHSKHSTQIFVPACTQAFPIFAESLRYSHSPRREQHSVVSLSVPAAASFFRLSGRSRSPRCSDNAGASRDQRAPAASLFCCRCLLRRLPRCALSRSLCLFVSTLGAGHGGREKRQSGSTRMKRAARLPPRPLQSQ